ncbi:D-erythronate dehydrogenase-like [Battus philenor]|uniref:D-erythronate dehydrogenase-like n=1 Tax=Battus philenor TaxID=42288 RepID=UPI0035CFB4F0
MNVAVTGAAGFLGDRLINAILAEDSPLKVASLLLVDTCVPRPRKDSRVRTLALDLSSPGAVEQIVTPERHVLFHLAAVVSGHAEADFDLGLAVNFDVTRALLEAARKRANNMRLVFASTVGVFGGDLPPVIEDWTAAMPQNTYGVAKALSELLINEYSRRGFVDGLVVRLPTVSVRGGAANRAVTSFASGIVREPLRGEIAICPVDEAQRLWLCSPRAAVRNILHAGTLNGAELGAWRVINLPGITAAVKEMIQALREVAGDEVAARIQFEHDETAARIVGSFPCQFDTKRAQRLGFVADRDFAEIIRNFIEEESETKVSQTV